MPNQPVAFISLPSIAEQINKVLVASLLAPRWTIYNLTTSTAYCIPTALSHHAGEYLQLQLLTIYNNPGKQALPCQSHSEYY